MEENNQRVIEIKPLSKWKRLLLFLGDYFIAFILSFALFNIAIFPLAKIICRTENMYSTYAQYENEANDLLINSGFLFKYTKNPAPTFEDDVKYTFRVFLSYYAFDDINPTQDNPQYGHRIENEVIYKYFISELSEAEYITAFKQENEKDQMFIIGENFESIKLKDDYKRYLSNELLETANEDNFSNMMINVRDHVFARLFYLHVYANITANDYIKDGISYNELVKNAKNVSISLQWVTVVSSLISVVVGWAPFCLIYPMINRDRRTLTLSVMKADRLNFKNLAPSDRWMVLVQSFYYLVFTLSYAMFLPALYFGFAYIFNLPLLLVFTLVSIVLMIASGIFIIFNEYNRSGTDILTNAVVVPSSELDNLYKEKLDNGCISSEGNIK